MSYISIAILDVSLFRNLVFKLNLAESSIAKLWNCELNCEIGYYESELGT